MENKFNVGDIVFEMTRPTNKLTIVRFDRGLYYCKASEAGHPKALVYFERELRAGTTPVVKK